MQINLPNDALLLERTRAAGFATVEEYVLDLNRRDALKPHMAGRATDNQQWVAEFRAMLADFESHNPNFDDSRESIYPVR